MTIPSSGLADASVNFIVQKIRHLTASSGENSLSTNSIYQYLNNFLTNDFPYAIKIDQLRSVYTFFTQPNVDRYPLDVNNNQGVRAPVYFQGVQGNFFKNRDQLFNLYPRYPTQFQVSPAADGKTFSFTLFGNNVNPFPQPNGGILSTQVTIGGIDINGNPINVVDDGGAVTTGSGIGGNTTVGQLIYTQQNQVGNQVNSNSTLQNLNSLPPYSPLPVPSPTPGASNQWYIGSVNYVTTQFNFVLPVAIQAGSQLNVWAAQYVVGRPYNLLFWNNELTVRPVPDNVYKVEVETFLSPLQFLLNTNSPVLNQWAQYLAYGSAMEILRDRQDMEGVENLREGFMRQEALVLERQSIEEIFQPNIQLFNSTQQSIGFGAGLGSFY